MSSFYLPNECIQDILNYVEEKDNKTLHSALLVNRTWCQNTVSFLWKKPFSSPPDSQNNYKIIPILASFIDDDEKKQFKIKEKELPVPKKTTFDYPSFIKHLDFVNLWKQVFKCTTSSRNSDHISMNELYPSTKFTMCPASLQDEFKSTLQQKAEVVKALYEVILQRNRLERLSLSMKDWHFPNYNEYIFDSLTSTPNAQNALARLTRFDCNLAATNFPVLSNLSSVSKGIKTLSIQIFRHIYRDGQLPELSKLIESQHALEQINIFKDHKCNDISIDLSALVSQTHSLKKLKLHYVTIDDEQLKHITKLQKLQELMFTCVRLRGKMTLLTNACFPNLKVLRIYSTFIYNNSNIHERSKSDQKEIDPFVGLMMNNGTHLRDLSLEFKLAFHPELLKNVAKYCENLITFTTYYYDVSDMSGIYEVLEKCSKIELFGIDGFANMPSDTIKKFSKKVPSNVKKLDFRYDCLDMDALKVFLESYEGHDVRYLICNVKGDKKVLKDMIEEISKGKGRNIKTCSVERGSSDEKVVNIEW
ncbi:17089_t:CDS:1 [Funneliformis caledonium]|uniref:17089_t:CDS:1 n=1 Tax=Funneliformis caledonium TaxID=1117310 RepID=A0A9N8ZV98_9GLOM|nr:17089_t:CDS:1 [Funneliformis caledonium]